MIEFSEEIIKLKTNKLIFGSHPIYIDVLASNDYEYKGKYLLTIHSDKIEFYKLKKNYKLETKKPERFYVKLDDIAGYHYAYHKDFAKRITLYFKNDLAFNFIFEMGYKEAYGNEDNAIYLMNLLKSLGKRQRPEVKENSGAKEIKKTDQYFVKEVRGTLPERRGLFGFKK